jgi:hypothetical protein
MTQSETPWTFTDEAAIRVATPLLTGIVGPSGTGKTYSALRLATGMRRVYGGEIFGIDTESGRMLHYAPEEGAKPDPANGKFDFRHVRFASPYPSLRYLAAIEHCVKRGAKVIVIDSMSHEHEGVGGVLEQHRDEAERLAKEWSSTVDAAKMSAWDKPKAGRRRLINTILTDLNVSCILNFRAKKKLHIATKEEKKANPKMESVSYRGMLPIAGEEFIYEMMLKCVLLPGARGVPTWKSDFPEEQDMMKIPRQFEHIFERPAPLSEDIGQQLAEWAAGASFKAPTDDDVGTSLTAAKEAKTLEELANVADSYKGKPWTTAQRKRLRDALEARKKELETKA